MKKLLALGLLGATLLVSASQAMAGSCGNNYWVQVNNNTGWEVYYIYPRNADQYYYNTNWDLLGNDTIPPYSSRNINIDDGYCYCVFSLWAKTEDGEHWWELTNSNVCRLENWNLN